MYVQDHLWLSSELAAEQKADNYYFWVHSMLHDDVLMYSKDFYKLQIISYALWPRILPLPFIYIFIYKFSRKNVVVLLRFRVTVSISRRFRVTVSISRRFRVTVSISRLYIARSGWISAMRLKNAVAVVDARLVIRTHSSSGIIEKIPARTTSSVMSVARWTGWCCFAVPEYLDRKSVV